MVVCTMSRKSVTQTKFHTEKKGGIIFDKKTNARKKGGRKKIEKNKELYIKKEKKTANKIPIYYTLHCKYI